MIVNPRDRLMIEERVRRISIEDQSESLWRGDDIINALCDSGDSKELVRHLRKGRGIFRDFPAVTMIDVDEDFNGTKFCAIEDRNLLGFVSLLPGQKAQHFKTDLAEFEKMEARRERFIRDRSKHWERLGGLFMTSRKALGLSLATVAGQLRISPSTISKFEKGMPIKMAIQIQRAYEMCLEVHAFRMTVSRRQELQPQIGSVHDRLLRKSAGFLRQSEAWEAEFENRCPCPSSDYCNGEPDERICPNFHLQETIDDMQELSVTAHRLAEALSRSLGAGFEEELAA